MFELYTVKSPSNKVYVGITSSGLNHRKLQHESDARRGSKLKFHNAIRKYGDSLEWQVVCTGMSHEEATQLEIDYIAELAETYNLTAGGEGVLGHKHTPEAKQKMREKKLGSTHTEETRKKMSKTRKGRRHSKAHCEALAKAHQYRATRIECSNGQIYNSITDASRKLGIGRAQIHR